MRHRTILFLMGAWMAVLLGSPSAFSQSAGSPALVTEASVAVVSPDGVVLADRVAEGDRVVYSVRVTNVGSETAYSVSLVSVLPEGFTYVSGTTAGTWPGGASAVDPAESPGPELLFDLRAMLPSGEPLDLTFEALVTAAVDGVGPYVATVSAVGMREGGGPIAADAAAGTPADTDPDDTSETALLPARPALVTRSRVVGIVRDGGAVSPVGPIEPGDTVMYNLTVENVGRGTVYNVGAEARLSAALSYVAGSSDASWPSGASTADPTGGGADMLVWSLSATLARADVLSLEFDVLVGSPLAEGPYESVLRASGSDADGSPTQPDRSFEAAADTDADDATSVLLDVIMPALAVDKEVIGVERGGTSLGSVPVGLPGDVVIFQVTVRNVGNGTAYNVDFRDQLPAGLVYEAAATRGDGAYVVTLPGMAGPLGVPDGAAAFTTGIDATIDSGGRLIASYAARITDAAPTGVPLANIVEVEGFSGAGVEIPDANAAVGDNFDDDAEDPDADDTAMAWVRVGLPLLTVAKEVADVERRGASVGVEGPVEPGDVIVWRLTVRNLGTDVAYDVGFVDVLPPGVEIETLYGDGALTVDRPAVEPTSLELVDGATGAVAVRLGVPVDRGAELVATYRTRVTSDVRQGTFLASTVIAFGRSADGVAVSSDDRSAGEPQSGTGSGVPVAEPALVVEQTIDSVERNGVRVAPTETVGPGDVITYRARVRNVGEGTAHAGGLAEPRPIGLAYRGPSRAVWPGGTSAADPARGADGALEWPLGASLRGGEALLVTFSVAVTAEAAQGDTVRNVVLARGEDGAGTSIPPDQSLDVALDSDSDDAAGVRLAVSSGTAPGGTPPSLRLSGSIARIVRSGTTIFERTTEAGDRITFELVVRNEGTRSAYDGTVTDFLPRGVTYVPGTTRIRWPFGLSLADPEGIPGAELRWELPVALRGGSAVTIQFDGQVGADASVGQTITHRAEVRGSDASGAPLAPPSEPMRSGMGALVIEPHVPAALVGGEADRPLVAVASSPEFQTDVACYAAAELAALAGWIEKREALGSDDLPMSLRTVATEAARVAFENWAEVEVGSGAGLPLSRGCEFRDAVDPEAAVRERLDACARAVGLDPATRPPNERWIVLEYAGGDPQFAVREAIPGPWPAGDWRAYDRRIMPSAVGMALRLQALEARRLLASERPQERYLGCVLVEAMASKIAALAELRAAPGSPDGLLAHAYAATPDGRRVTYTVIDSRVDLFDQAALAWGLSAFLELVSDGSLAWPPPLGSLREDAERARQELERVLEGTRRALCGFDGVLRESTADRTGAPVRTATLGLLLAALDDVSRAVGPHSAVLRLATHAALELSRRVGPDGQLRPSPSSPQVGDACAAVSGFLAASHILGVPAYESAAAHALESLDHDFWDARLGAYAASPPGVVSRTCVSAMDLGLLVSALREGTGLLAPDDAERVFSRLASHVRTVAGLALQLHGRAGDSRAEEVGACGSFGCAFVLRETQCYELGMLPGMLP